MSYRNYYDKSLSYLFKEESMYNSDYSAKRRAKSRLRMYANLFNRDMRKVLINKNSVCKYCDSTNNLQIDHIKPISKGGINKIENVQILCSHCNIKKTNHEI